jgi:transglutaminase-like putative cysteine protease
MTATLPPPAVREAVASRGLAVRSSLLVPSLAGAAAVLLASMSLAPVMFEGGWFGATLVTVLAVTTVGTAALWLRLPLFLVPLVQAFVLFAVLVASFTEEAPWGFFPSPDALSDLRGVLATGMHDIDIYAPPVPVNDGITALIALGIGCVAIVVFVLHVAMRMPVVAGLGLVAVYVVPSLVLTGGSPWWCFVCLAVGWMLLFVSDERVGVAAWGRLLRRADSGAPSALSGLSSAALRIGVVGIVVALTLPVLVPALTDAVLGRHDSGIGSPDDNASASSGHVGLDPTVSLRRSLTTQSDNVMFTYSTTAAKPSYLPVVVVTEYTNETWHAASFTPDSADPVEQGIAADGNLSTTLLAGAGQVAYSVTDRSLNSPYLPVPEHLTALTGLQGSWYVDHSTRTVFGVDQASSADQRWQAIAADVPVSPAALRAVPAPPTTAPDHGRDSTIPGRLAADATTVTAGLATPYDKVLAIQNWFLQNFQYSTDTISATPAPGSSYLDQFLDDQSGYCQQFASAMALMVQSIGLQARVVVGYTQGTQQPDGTWVVKGRDAHAWPEVYFAGFGWVRFEPTPAGSGVGQGSVQRPPYATGAAGGTTTGTQGSKQPGRRPPPQVHAPEDLGPVADVTAAEYGTATTADQWRLRGIGATLVLLALLAAVPALWRWGRRRRRLSAQAEIEDFWEELRDTALDLGIAWPPSRTPRQAVASVIATQHLRGPAAEAATRVGRATEQARYAATPPASDGLAEDVGTVRSALLARAERGQRWRSILVPASLRRRPD